MLPSSRRLLFAALMLFAGLVLPLVPAGAQDSTAPAVAEPTGLHGAGFQNVVAIDPSGSGLVIAGADVAGLHRSTDWGLTWEAANVGVTSISELKVAAVAFSSHESGVVYAGLGHRGSGGGFFASSDGGRSWVRRSAVPQFGGGNNRGYGGLPGTHPRSTGNLFAEGSAGQLYAATFEDGLMRSNDGGRTWTTLGLDGKFLRAVAVDPGSPGVVYAAAYGDALYRVTDGSGGVSITRLSASPVSVEDLVVLDGRVYAAAGGDGVFVSGNGGGSWSRLGSGVLPNGPVYKSIAGTVTGGAHELYVGVDKPVQLSEQGSGHAALFRSRDGGATWTSLTSDLSKISYEISSPGGEVWWLSQSHRSMMLGKGTYTTSHIALHPASGRVIVAGRSGLWGSTDRGASWHPYVRHLGVTINRAVVADPNVQGRVYVANTDWVLLHSTDALKTIGQNRPPTGNMGYGLALDTSTTPSTVYSAVGHRDNNTDGEIYVSPDPTTSGWTGEGLGAATGGKRPLGIGVGRVNGSRVIVAAVENSGIWRKAGSSWSRVDSTAMGGTQRTKTASVSWVPGSMTVYLYDRETGVWRSNDAGASWTRIWSQTSPQEMSGYVAADPQDPSRLYVSVLNQGVFRLNGATSGTVGNGITAEKVGDFKRPGPIALTPDGALYVSETVNGSYPTATLQRSSDRGASWQLLSDDRYRATAAFPFDLSVAPDGTAHLALNGNGALRVASSTGESAPPIDETAPQITITSPTQDESFTSQVPFAGSASDDVGVESVLYAVQDRVSKQWWHADGSWGSYVRHTATVASPGATTTSWSAEWAPPASGDYGVLVTGRDAAGNETTGWQSFSYEESVDPLDQTAPEITITSPTQDESFTSQVPFAGSASDDVGVESVLYAVQDRVSKQWWHADGSWGSYVRHTATVASPGATTTSWSAEWAPPAAGDYGVLVTGRDAAGNETTGWQRFTYEQSSDLRVTDVRFAAWGGPTKSLHVDATLTVSTSSGAAAGANVEAALLRNGSNHTTFSGSTASDGTLTTRFSRLPSGCYTIVVRDVALNGEVWDGTTPPNQFCRS